LNGKDIKIKKELFLMLNISGRNITVYDVNEKENYVIANLGTYKKDKEGNFINMYWRARFVGEAKRKATLLNERDKIHITNGIIENNYDKDKNTKWYNITVFDFSHQQAT
jgi:hypothetical protein